MVVSSDPELEEMAAALLPDLAARSGMELKAPVRLEMRSREQLVRYLEAKLEAELPAELVEARVESYALFGLVSAELDLRSVLLDLYTEQVAGFYEPDSTALFVMDDQPAALLEGVLLHELVHAVQDQTVDLDALTDPARGNDRATAAQAAIEGHATLVMLELMTERMSGRPVDLGQVPDFAAQLRPALEGMRAQYPALASAPAVIQEAMLFPYLEGAGYVQKLWSEGARVAPFGENLPQSTEQVVTGDLSDEPVRFDVRVEGARVLHEDGLGRLETGVLLEQHLGDAEASRLAVGWSGDRYALVEEEGGARGLVWFSLWDDAPTRDAFADALERARGGFGAPAEIERLEALGRPAVRLTLGAIDGGAARALPLEPT
jgi:hypothetical protein